MSNDAVKVNGTELITIVPRVAQAIRGLSIDAIEAAGCGHPGLPLGCAELVAYLYVHGLRYSSAHPNWLNRDRFILSAGHGSMVLYAALHLAGYNVTLDDIKQFRQYQSITPGHPEYGMTDGVETTTGPLGQGLATAIGMALGNKLTAGRLSLTSDILDATIYVLAGDGDMMEGITSEASSLAGHLNLSNVIVFYDANDICLDGPIDETLSEDTAMRYRSYGWFVQSIDGHDVAAIHQATEHAKAADAPSLIIAKTVIGNGAPNVQGTSEVHGKAMGPEEAALTKQAHEIPLEPLFYVDDEVRSFFKTKKQNDADSVKAWHHRMDTWSADHPDEAKKLDAALKHHIPTDLSDRLREIPTKTGGASRQASNAVLQFLREELPHLIVGSADLSCSDNTVLTASSIVRRDNFSGRNIKYGVREFAMAAMASGLALQGASLPVCGTFLTFSDYMRNAIRLAALMKLHVIYHFTHDSIFLGEDGPTHQPVEHVSSLRMMPGLTVIRPADAEETKGAWLAALAQKGPVALVLSRQGLPDLDASNMSSVAKGAYVVKKERNNGCIDICLLSTGSEVALALEVADVLEAREQSVRVVSMPSWELFDAQDDDYRNDVLGRNVGRYCSIEAQVSFGWHRYIGRDGLAISVETFGESAPASDLKRHFGFDPTHIAERLMGERP